MIATTTKRCQQYRSPWTRHGLVCIRICNTPQICHGCTNGTHLRAFFKINWQFYYWPPLDVEMCVAYISNLHIAMCWCVSLVVLKFHLCIEGHVRFHISNGGTCRFVSWNYIWKRNECQNSFMCGRVDVSMLKGVVTCMCHLVCNVIFIFVAIGLFVENGVST